MDSVGTKHSLLVRQRFSYTSNYITLRVLCFKGKQSLLIQAVRINCGSLILKVLAKSFYSEHPYARHPTLHKSLWEWLGFQTLCSFYCSFWAKVQQGVCLNRNGLRELYKKLYFTWLLLHLLSLFLIKWKWILEFALLSLCVTRRPWSSRCVLPQKESESDAARVGCWVNDPWQPKAICSSNTFWKFEKLYLIGRKDIKCLHRGSLHENTCCLLSVDFNLKSFTVLYESR